MFTLALDLCTINFWFHNTASWVKVLCFFDPVVQPKLLLKRSFLL